MVDVLIVGAGPTGLALACELIRRGVKIRLIDKGQGPSIHSKALGIHARTLEILEKMGVVESFIAKGLKTSGVVFHHGKKEAKLAFEPLEAPYPFVITLPQADTEKILLKHLEKLGGKVEWNTELVSLEETEASLAINGREERFSAPWIVGCDGARSRVRHQLNYPFEGTELPETFFIADVRAQAAFTIDCPHAFLTKYGIAVIMPFPSAGLYRLILPMKSPTDEMDQLILERNLSDVLKIEKEEWVSKFQVHRRLVRQMRKKQVFLVGDAAHIHSPAGGQGMNTCIQDAFNLAWKLALVIHKKSPEALLDTYQSERHPVALDVLRNTTRATKMLIFFQKFSLSLFFFIMSQILSKRFFRKKIVLKLSELSVAYPNSPIVAGPARDKHAKGPKPGERAPDVIFPDKARLFLHLMSPKHVLLLFEDHRDFRKQIEEKYGEIVDVQILTDSVSKEKYAAGPHTLYLIRPDGYVGYRSINFRQEEVMAYLKKIFCAPNSQTE